MKAVSAYMVLKHPKDYEAWHDAYGIWFAGEFRVGIENKHSPQTWACITVKSEKLEEGEFDIDVFGKPGKLIFWWAQGYPRGIIISTDEFELIDNLRQTPSFRAGKDSKGLNPVSAVVRRTVE